MADREADRRAIRAIVLEHERGFNEKDPARMAAGHAMIALYVFARGGEGWEVVARQDTLVR